MSKEFRLAVVIILLGLFAGGCGVHKGVTAAENRGNLSKINAGMNKSDVLEVMGRPYKTLAFDSDDVKVERWYYITDQTVFWLVTNFTVLEFDDGKLESWHD